jgi:hypothetical protein
MGIEYDNGSGSGSGSGSSMTDAEIRTAVENATDSNVFNDADHTKLNGIEAGATGDQTDAEIRTAVENATNSNVFTDADHTKLNNLLSLTSKGDLLSNNGSIDVALGVGTNGQVLVADSTEASGLKWQGNNTIGTKVLVTGSLAGSGTLQTIAVGQTKIEFDDSVTGGTDINTEWNNTNHRFTVGSSGSGVYIFQVSLFIESSSGWGSVHLKKNGTQLGTQNIGVSSHTNGFDSIDGSVAVELAVGDYVEFWTNWRTGTGAIKDVWGKEIQTFSITKVGESITVNNVVAPTLNKTFTRESPTASDDLTIFRTDVAITVVEVIACSVGTSPSTTYQLKHHTDRNTSSGNNLTTSASTTSRTTGNIATLDDVTIPANSWIWYESTVASGTDIILTIDIRYTED